LIFIWSSTASKMVFEARLHNSTFIYAVDSGWWTSGCRDPQCAGTSDSCRSSPAALQSCLQNRHITFRASVVIIQHPPDEACGMEAVSAPRADPIGGIGLFAD
jgi:hypothetical protein